MISAAIALIGGLTGMAGEGLGADVMGAF